jgi:hypothetical protein
MATKPFWQSKTLWFNLIAAAFVFADQNMVMAQKLMGPEAYLYFMAVVTAGNAFLRVITAKPLLLAAPKDEPK